MNIKDKIIHKLEEIELSTEELGDALGKTGVIKNVYPINSGKYVVGEIQYFYAHSNSNWPVHDQLRSLKQNKICFIDSLFVNEEDYAIFGELVSTFIIEKKEAKAIVVNGRLRDLSGLKKRNYPVWCKGITPIGCFNFNVPENAEIKRLAKQRYDYFDGAIMVCDDSGVVVLPKEEINDAFLEKISNMRKQEEIWFDCVEKKDWDTFDTVCLKKYLDKK